MVMNFIDSARFMAISFEILFIIAQKEFIKLNLKIVVVFLSMKVLNTIW